MIREVSIFCIILVAVAAVSGLSFETTDAENEINRQNLVEPVSTSRFRVMTFNTWECGAEVNDGLNKIVKHVKLVNPDVVCFQEINYQQPECFAQLTQALGRAWHCVMREGSYPDSAICSRHALLRNTYSQTEHAVGIKLLLRAQHTHSNYEHSSYMNVSVWSGHFDWRNFAGDAACNKLTDDVTSFYAGEMDVGYSLSGRVSNAKMLLANEQFAEALCNADQEPLIFGADLNVGSHLDWTEAAAAQHCGWAVPLPATKALLQAGLSDSYRLLHPDPVKDPGITWSTVNKYLKDWGYTIPTPQDRIDLILFKSRRLRPVASGAYQGTEPINYIPYQQDNDWPSDHAAFVTDFEIVL